MQVMTYRGDTPTVVEVKQDYTGDGQTDATIKVTEQSAYTSTFISTDDLDW